MARVGFVLLTVWLLAQIVLSSLTLSDDVATALAFATENQVLLLVVALGLLVVALDPVQALLGWRASLEFGEPFVASDKGIVVPTFRLRSEGTSAGSNYTPERRAAPTIERGTEMRPALFLHVRVRNTSKKVDAEAVVNHLRYFDGESLSLLFELDGRWAESPQLIDGAFERDITDVLRIPIWRALTIDLGFVVNGERDLYAFNTSVTARTADWKLEEYRLAPGRYFVSVEVHSRNADDLVGWFEVLHGGEDMTPTLRKTGRPAGLH